MKAICVFCGSSDQVHPEYRAAAHHLGAVLAQRGLTLVYGAGRTGLMGAVADGVLENGGEVVGVLPKLFYNPILAHMNLTHLEIVENMHARKARMAELADGFIALPGGYGTFDELFEILTWAQIGLHTKPVGLLNIRSYFDALLQMVERASSEGFIYSEHRRLFMFELQPDALLDAMHNYRPPEDLARWVERDE